MYKKYRNLEGREYLEVSDISGAQPLQYKQNKPQTGPDYILYTKDINPDKWQTKRVVNPLQPEYEFPTKSGRMVRLGNIERNRPKQNISPETRRMANYIDDIDGTKPRKLNSITEDQRSKVKENGSSVYSNYSR